MTTTTAAQIFVITGPSGVGKGTVCDALMQRFPQLCLSISATSRPKRAHEKDSVNYFFKTRSEFEAMIDHDRQEADPQRHILLEWAEYNGNYYGTLRQTVNHALQTGQHLLLEIETQGALMVKQKFPAACLIFLLPPDIESLEARLQGRGTESPEQIENRLRLARQELSLQDRFDHRVVNDSLDHCVQAVRDIVAQQISLCSQA